MFQAPALPQWDEFVIGDCLFHCTVSQGSGKLLIFCIIVFTLPFQMSSNVSKLNTQETEEALIGFSKAEISRFSSTGFHFTLQIMFVPSESLWLPRLL